VLSRVAKSLIGLLVLLAWPCLGLGGSARAAFVITLGADEALVSGASSGGAGEEGGSRDTGTPGRASLPRHLVPAGPSFQPSSTAGGTTSSGPGAGPGGPGLVGLLIADSPRLQSVGTGILFLSDERFKPPPFASRLFRPPR